MSSVQVYLQLAADTPTADEVKPGWIALVIVLLMAVALAGLMRSMVKQFRKVDFEEKEPDAGGDGAPESDSTADDPEREINGSSH